MRSKIIILSMAVLSLIGLAFTNINSKTIKSSAITFDIKNLGLNVDGKIGNLKTTVFKFDEDSLSKCEIEATVDVSTINTGIGKRDEHLKAEEYFDAKKFPTIKMVSSRFAKAKAGNLIGYFKLTIKGVTKEITMPIYVTKKTDGTELKGNFTINRLDYKIGTSSNVLSNNAKITIFVKTN